MSTECTVVFWDVQHGHSTYIKTPNNRHIVVDLGTGKYSDNKSDFSPLKHLMNNYGVSQLDYLVITHPHLDHIDDILNFDLLFPQILSIPSQLTNSEVLSGVLEKDKPKFMKYCQIVDIYNIHLNDEEIFKRELWGDVKIISFSPTNCNHDNFNNHSIVVVIEHAGIKIVIPGDNEDPSFKELMELPSFISAIKNSDILLAPHHGRESGFNSNFVKEVNPRLTIVSDGRFCDTSANERYSQKSRGWSVFKKDGTKLSRYCLTTNSDGEILVKFGYSTDLKDKKYLNVKIDK